MVTGYFLQSNEACKYFFLNKSRCNKAVDVAANYIFSPALCEKNVLLFS